VVVDDDGSETPEELHRAVRAAGFDFSLHTPHSVHVDGYVPGLAPDGNVPGDATRGHSFQLEPPIEDTAPHSCACGLLVVVDAHHRTA
jgi:hypothetical protein